MKGNIIILMILLSSVELCYSQNDSVDLSRLIFDQHPIIKHYTDCQVFDYYSDKPSNKQLVRSYKFDDTGNILEKLVTQTLQAISKSVYHYENNKLLDITIYTKSGFDSLFDVLKTFYKYNDKNQIIKRTSYIYSRILDDNDSTSNYLGRKWNLCNEFLNEYNSKGQECIKIAIRNGCGNILNEGVTKLFYDAIGRISSYKYYMQDDYLHIKDSLSSVTKYTYFDNSYQALTITQNAIYNAVYTKNKNGQLIQKENIWTQGVMNKFSNNEYIPNIDTTSSEYSFQSFKTFYQYDNSNRINKITKSIGKIEDISEYIYGTEKPVIIPSKEYLEYYDDY